MKIVIIFFAMILFPISIDIAQPIDTLWTRTISAAPAGDVISYEMIKYSSNEYIVAGGFDDSLYIVKVNTSGDKVWEKYWYSAGGLFGTAIDKDSFGNFYVVVWNYNLSNQWKLIKFNGSGDSLWSHTVTDAASSFHIPYSITVDGDYIYVAASAGNGPENYALHKFNSDGDELYVKTYLTGSGFSIPRSITHDSNGNIILAGSGGSGWGWYILKCNSDGDTLWSKSLYSIGQEARNVLTDNEDNVIVAGWTNKILKYDPDGNLLFSKTLGGDDNWEGASLIKYDDENVFVVGAKRRGAGSWAFDLLLGKYSLGTGDSVWTDIWYYPEPNFGIYGWDGAVFSDSSLVVLAQTHIVIGGSGYSNIYLMNFSLSDIPVPVELTSFTAAAEGNKVTINWSTASETNNQGFEIQRKSVNSQFENIGFVNGYGTTTRMHQYSFTDDNIADGKFTYRLRQIDFDGSFTYSKEVEVDINNPFRFTLSQNYPNPFNPTTQIKYSTPKDGFVSLKVYNTLGQQVAILENGFVKTGEHEITFDGGKLSSGVYYYRIESGNNILVKKMILLR